MKLSNDIVLRPRFQRSLFIDASDLKKLFDSHINKDSKYSLKRLDEHIFIRLPRAEQHFWSPQLHLEIFEADDETRLHGFFGPNPKMWTLFIFLHFIVATLFIGFGIWAYTHWSLDQPYAIQLFLMFLSVILWFVLYFAGRIGKAKGRPQMRELYGFLEGILSHIKH